MAAGSSAGGAVFFVQFPSEFSILNGRQDTVFPVSRSVGQSCQLLFWFHVNKNLCYLRQCPEDFVFDHMG